MAKVLFAQGVPSLGKPKHSKTSAHPIVSGEWSFKTLQCIGRIGHLEQYTIIHWMEVVVVVLWNSHTQQAEYKT